MHRFAALRSERVGAASLVLIAILMVSAQAAQSGQSAREVLIGSTKDPEAARARAIAAARDERAAQILYEDARDDLAQGRRSAAERLLDALIARYPETNAARQASDDMAAIHDASRNSIADAGQGTRRSHAGEHSRPSELARSRLSSSPAITDGWRAKVTHAAPSAQDTMRGITGDRVFFSEGSAELGQKARAALAAQAKWLLSNDIVAMTVEGHSDDPGSSTDNRDLAKRRAEAVRDRLIEEGVDSRRIAVMDFGRDRPVSLCTEALCAAQNRRAVTIVTGTTAAEQAAAGRAATPR